MFSDKEKLILFSVLGVAILGVIILIIIKYKKEQYLASNGTYQAATSASVATGLPLTISQPQANLALVSDANGNLSTSPAVPIGSIVMWAGTTSAIPTGWALCDGSSILINGSQVTLPDLRSRFVLGASADGTGSGSAIANSTYNNNLTAFPPGSVGGEEVHTLSINEIPAHSHSFTVFQGGATPGNAGDGRNFGQPAYTLDPFGGGGVIGSTGSGWAHNNVPQFIALAYIMKIA